MKVMVVVNVVVVDVYDFLPSRNFCFAFAILAFPHASRERPTWRCGWTGDVLPKLLHCHIAPAATTAAATTSSVVPMLGGDCLVPQRETIVALEGCFVR